MPKCTHLILTEKGWECTKLKKIIRNKNRCITGKNGRRCIEPIDPDEIDKAYEEIREEQREEWKDLPKSKKIRALNEVIEFVKQMRDGKNIGRYKMAIKKGRIWMEKGN